MKRHFLPIFLIAVISIALYSNTLNNGFVYDDKTAIVNNNFIKDLKNLPKLFDKSYFVLSGENTYRPIVTFTYFLDYTLYGLKPRGFHLTNVLLHALNCILLYIFLTVLSQSAAVPIQSSTIKSLLANRTLLVTLLFVSHPLLTEPVNAASFREDLLVFLFYMATLSIYIYLRAKRLAVCKSLLYTISCLLYSLALLSKEMAITLPLIVYCYEWVYSEGDKRRLRAILFNRYNIGYIAVTLAYVYIRFYHFRDPSEARFQSWELTERLLTIPYLILSYLKLTIFPVFLSADYEVIPLNSIFSATFMSSAIVVILLLFMSLKRVTKEKDIAFGILFYIIALLPVYNIIPFAFPFAARYLYLPITGFFIIIRSIVYLLPNKSKFHVFYLAISFFTILTIFFAGVISRNAVWRDEISLWSDAVKKMPNNSHSHLGLGLAYQEKGLLEKAVSQYKTALRLKPDDADAYNNLGNIYLDQQRYEEAIWHYKNALNYRNVPSFHNNLGIAFYETGQVEKAILHYKIALTLKADYSDSHNNLGSAYADQGKIEEAIKEYQTAIMLDPTNARAHNNLGLIWVNQQNFDDAVQEYHDAIRIDPGLTEAHYNMGIVYLKKGLKNKAMMEFETALKIRPDLVSARRALESIDSGKNQ